MISKTLSAGTLSRLFAVLVGLVILAGCGGGSSSTSTSTGSPAVTITGSTLTSNTLTFSSAVGVTSAPQTLTITDRNRGPDLFRLLTGH